MHKQMREFENSNDPSGEATLSKSAGRPKRTGAS